MSHRNEKGLTEEQQWELDSHRGARMDFKHDARFHFRDGNRIKSREMSRKAGQCTVAIVAMERGFKIAAKIFEEN